MTYETLKKKSVKLGLSFAAGLDVLFFKESREASSFSISNSISLSLYNNGTQRDRVVLRARLRRDFVSKQQQWFYKRRFGDEWCRG